MGRFGRAFGGIHIKKKVLPIAALLTISSAVTADPAHAQQTVDAMHNYLSVINDIRENGTKEVSVAGKTSRAIGLLVKAIEQDIKDSIIRANYQEAGYLLQALHRIAEVCGDQELADAVRVMSSGILHPSELAGNEEIAQMVDEILGLSNKELEQIIRSRGFPDLDVNVRVSKGNEFIIYTHQRGHTNILVGNFHDHGPRTKEHEIFTPQDIKHAIIAQAPNLSHIEFNFVYDEIAEYLERNGQFRK